ncbi:DUF502 domain-containing protein [Halomarina rubra]|uniref:DUF502 domain-containing protein n=1 Tax=Halomarina rubra TaxID=2071873 RepID=A0ABD6B150_9EURY|nr:DUF502 domain-containing protein [Halomarina rubra]
METWRRDLVRGLALVVPVALVLAVCLLLYDWVAALGVPPGYPAPIRVGVVVLAFVAVVVTVGRVMGTAIGPFVDRAADSSVNRLPVLRVVYNAAKFTIRRLLSGDERTRTPVKVESWPGQWMTGFRTGVRAPDGDVMVFLPGAPDPTSGMLVAVDPDHVEESDETISAALIRVISCGCSNGEDFGERKRPFDE